MKTSSLGLGRTNQVAGPLAWALAGVVPFVVPLVLLIAVLFVVPLPSACCRLPTDDCPLPLPLPFVTPLPLVVPLSSPFFCAAEPLDRISWPLWYFGT